MTEIRQLLAKLLPRIISLILSFNVLLTSIMKILAASPLETLKAGEGGGVDIFSTGDFLMKCGGTPPQNSCKPNIDL